MVLSFIQNEVQSTVLHAAYVPKIGMTLESFRVLGLKTQPSSVKINGQPVQFHYSSTNKVGHCIISPLLLFYIYILYYL